MDWMAGYRLPPTGGGGASATGTDLDGGGSAGTNGDMTSPIPTTPSPNTMVHGGGGWGSALTGGGGPLGGGGLPQVKQEAVSPSPQGGNGGGHHTTSISAPGSIKGKKLENFGVGGYGALLTFKNPYKSFVSLIHIIHGRRGGGV